MRAFVICHQGATPRLQEFAAPKTVAGATAIQVSAAGLGPTDLMRAEGFFAPVTAPYIVGGEGVGRLADGTAGYFGRAVAPLGAWAERTPVPDEELWPLSDEIEDEQAIALGISGPGALIPLEEA